MKFIFMFMLQQKLFCFTDSVFGLTGNSDITKSNIKTRMNKIDGALLKCWRDRVIEIKDDNYLKKIFDGIKAIRDDRTTRTRMDDIIHFTDGN